jgi:hypothetical protein
MGAKSYLPQLFLSKKKINGTWNAWKTSKLQVQQIISGVFRDVEDVLY